MKLRSLAELQGLKMQFEHERREARGQARRRAEEQPLFARSVGPVTQLRDRGLAELRRPQPAPQPVRRHRDEQAALQEALSDEMDVERLLETDEGLSFRRPGIAPGVLQRLRRGEWAVQAQVDLHGLRRDEARGRLVEFLRESSRRGWRCVRVVHGKGLGSPGREPVLKGKVRVWLVQKQQVLAFTQARAWEGGAGALVVLLEGKLPAEAPTIDKPMVP